MGLKEDFLIGLATDEVEKLRAENRELRHALLQMCQEKTAILEAVARQDIRIKELQRKAGLAPHDWEPTWRPGVEDVD